MLVIARVRYHQKKNEYFLNGEDNSKILHSACMIDLCTLQFAADRIDVKRKSTHFKAKLVIEFISIRYKNIKKLQSE